MSQPKFYVIERSLMAGILDAAQTGLLHREECASPYVDSAEHKALVSLISMLDAPASDDHRMQIQSILGELIHNYTLDVLDGEDDETLKDPVPEHRIQDFIVYVDLGLRQGEYKSLRPSIGTPAPTPIDASIHVFNTGRLYQSYGQLIGWQHLPDGRVAFNDISRMIDGISIKPMQRPTNEQVLSMYDAHRHGNYTYEYGRNEAERSSIRECGEAAREIQP
jgi:hypothetical protein